MKRVIYTAKNIYNRMSHQSYETISKFNLKYFTSKVDRNGSEKISDAVLGGWLFRVRPTTV